VEFWVAHMSYQDAFNLVVLLSVAHMSYQDAFNLVVLLRCTEIRNVWGIVMCTT